MHRKLLLLVIIIFVLLGGFVGFTLFMRYEKSGVKTHNALIVQHTATSSNDRGGNYYMPTVTEEEPSIGVFYGLPKYTTVPPKKSTGGENGITPEEACMMELIYPYQVKAEAVADGVLIKWPRTGQDGVTYEIYRKVYNVIGDRLPLNGYEHIGDIQSIENRELGFEDAEVWYELKDTTAETGIQYIYGVRAMRVWLKCTTYSRTNESNPISRQ